MRAVARSYGGLGIRAAARTCGGLGMRGAAHSYRGLECGPPPFMHGRVAAGRPRWCATKKGTTRGALLDRQRWAIFVDLKATCGSA